MFRIGQRFVHIGYRHTFWSGTSMERDSLGVRSLSTGRLSLCYPVEEALFIHQRALVDLGVVSWGAAAKAPDRYRGERE